MTLPLRRFTRRRALAGAAAVAGAAVVADRLTASGRGRPAPVAGQHRYEADFVAAADGWGRGWVPLHYHGRLSADGGLATFRVPDGLRGAAKHQPMPVQLLDHECADCEQLATFGVSDPSLRPGLMFGGRGPFEYHAVTVEGARLVLARYRRDGRTVAGHAPVSPLTAGVGAHLRVAVEAGRARARIWEEGSDEPDWQLDVAVPPEGGTPGIVLVQPTSGRASSVDVAGYALGSQKAFESTEPFALLTLTGIPIASRGRATAVARVWSAYPATVTIEWARDAGFADPGSAPPADAIDGPRTASADLPVPRRGPLRWRARLVSRSSGAVSLTEPHEVALPDPAARLVLLAASCVQVTGLAPNPGFGRLLEAASGRPGALVFQGDLGYANNQTDAAYAAAPDFFADRFARFFADPHFVELRRGVPVGFTIDDHDYGPENNADRTTVEPWAIALWNRIHADPSSTGYFDFRFGDVHCLTLDGRRYADPVGDPDTAQKTKVGREQLEWLRATLAGSDAALFVVYSADSFAHRENPRHPELEGARLDCFAGGWPADYRRVLTLFMDLQLDGRRVVILSGDAHGLRIHYHPDPAGRPAAAGLSILEFICSGLNPLLWSGPVPTDPSLDRRRNVAGVPGGGLMAIDPPGTPDRSIVLRAVTAQPPADLDAFPPLRIAFRPANDRAAAAL